MQSWEENERYTLSDLVSGFWKGMNDALALFDVYINDGFDICYGILRNVMLPSSEVEEGFVRDKRGDWHIESRYNLGSIDDYL
tara:strand:- start:8687 stop:8935 length:249 start_codon:yes stop_codon:yes gene_type:complete